MNKVTTAAEAIKAIRDGDTLLVGGFLWAGSPETLIGKLFEESGAKDLTVVSNDLGTAESNMYKMQAAGRVKKVHGSYVGANPMTGKMMFNDPASVTLWPQGTLAEKLRAGGAGIKAFYTPVGVGTIVEEGKEKRTFDGVEYLLEMGMRGNVALIKAAVADKSGNCFMKGTAKNFGAIMARAADHVIAEAEKIVEVGEIDPEMVTVPGIFVDAVVASEV
jgi:acetate CoA/acetoacetate CoA-transferase alpha subunit